MKKVILTLIAIICFYSCETAEQKQYNQFKDKVFDSAYLQRSFKNYTDISLSISSAQNGYINQQQYITNYNNELGKYFGYTKNLDTIAANLKRKGNLYQKYIVSDAFLHFSKDSLQAKHYTKEKDSILKLLKTL